MLIGHLHLFFSEMSVRGTVLNWVGQSLALYPFPHILAGFPFIG